MNDIVKRGISRQKIDKLEIRDFNLQRIIADALINNGYDVDITQTNDNFNGPLVQELNIYAVRE